MWLAAAAQRSGKSVPDVTPPNLVRQTIGQEVALEAAEEGDAGDRRVFFTWWIRKYWSLVCLPKAALVRKKKKKSIRGLVIVG